LKITLYYFTEFGQLKTVQFIQEKSIEIEFQTVQRMKMCFVYFRRCTV